MLDQARDPHREDEEHADGEHGGDEDRAGPGPPGELLLALGKLGAGGDRERAHPNRQRLRHRDDATDQRPAEDASTPRPRHERERADEDLAEPSTAGVLSGGHAYGLLCDRLAHRDRPRRHATHHHPLEDGLAAHRRVPLGDEPRGRQARVATRPHGQHPLYVPEAAAARRPLAARRWKRSTRPPVSTSFWRPV